MMDMSYGIGILQDYEAFFVHSDLEGFEYVPGPVADLSTIHRE